MNAVLVTYVVANEAGEKADEFAARDHTAARTEFARRRYEPGSSLYDPGEWEKVERGIRSARRIAFTSPSQPA